MTRQNEDGAVLITTLLIMSLIATLAVSIMDDVLYATKRLIAAEDGAQAAHYVNGAEEFALATIADQLETTSLADLNSFLLSGQTIIFPITDGNLTVRFRDAANCLSPHITENAGAQERFIRFLRQSSSGQSAEQIMLAIKDWQDADQASQGGAEDGYYLNQTPAYRTADSPVTTVSELRAIRGITQELYAEIAPYLCVKPGADPAVNINTLLPTEWPVLSASLGMPATMARDLLAKRPSEGWDVSAFAELPEFDDEDFAAYLDLIRYEPDLLRVNIRVEYRGSVRHSQLMVTADRNPRVIHRIRGEAALFPVPAVEGN